MMFQTETKKEPRTGPAIALVETASIARGFTVCDSMVKRAPVDILIATSVTPGKHLVLVTGEVAEVEEAMFAGLEMAGDRLLDSLILPYPHRRLVPAIRGAMTSIEDFPNGEVGAVAIMELSSVASAILAADAALKASDVVLGHMHLARGIGGKAYFWVSGELHDVQASVCAAQQAVVPERWVDIETIARPHEDFIQQLGIMNL